MTRALEVFRFELAYQLRRMSNRLYFVVFAAFATFVARIFFENARNNGFFFNAPIITMAVTIAASMFALLISAAVAGDCATRDRETRMDSLLFTTPLRKAAFLGGRLAGALTMTALILLAVPVGLLIATNMPGLDAKLIGPFRADAYLASYFVFALPNAFFSTAVLFSIAALTRRAMAAYAGAAVLFAIPIGTDAFLSARLGHWGTAEMLDPLGFTMVRSLWRSLNPLQRNSMLGIDTAVMTNRALWMSVAVAVFAVAAYRFQFADAASARGSVRDEVLPPAKPRTFVLPELRMPRRMGQLLEITFESTRDLVFSKAWLLTPITTVIFILTAPELLEVELGTPGAATSARVAALIAPQELAMLITLLIALSAAQLVWRERDARTHAVTDATPLPDWIPVTGKFLAIAGMLAATHVVFFLAAIGVQIMQGADRIDLPVILQILSMQFSGYLLTAALAMFIQTIVNQKHAGIVLTMLTYFGVDIARELGVQHNLLLYGHGPEGMFSEMAGFGLQGGPWLWFRTYWSGWALLLAVVTYLFWTRGEERGAGRRFALARARLRGWPRAIGVAALAIVCGTGAFIFYNTNILNPYVSDADAEKRDADYELRYGRYASLPQPSLTATKLRVDFQTKSNRATVRGDYRLENRTAATIDAIHVVCNRRVKTGNVDFGRASRLVLSDDALGYRIYSLAQPLLPGQSMHMTFEVDYAPRGFTNFGRSEVVMANGSWIQHRADQSHSARQWLPFIGYQSPDRGPAPSLDDVKARNDGRGREKIELDIVASTDGNQIAVAPGELRRAWSENGRRLFHYVTDSQITNGYAIFSANYAVTRASWRDVAIEVFHHPDHTANIERLVRSVRASLDAYTRRFGPYPHRQLRLVEYPSAGGGLRLTSYEGLITFSEGFALVRPDADERRIDLPFAVVAHEVAHQWWGHQVLPAWVEGAPLLSESLAWYSAMLAVEDTQGRDHLLRLLDVMRREYLAPHETRSVPLLRTVDRLDAYRTGPFAMFALREIVGEAPVNGALRALLAKFDPKHAPYPTSRDLYDELRKVTPDRALLADLFENITYWDLRTKRVDVTATNGAYSVRMQVSAQKLRADAMGKETMVPLSDIVKVAVFDENGKTLYAKPHRIKSGEQTIVVNVAKKPASAGIDPDHVLLDRNLEDNVKKIEDSV